MTVEFEAPRPTWEKPCEECGAMLVRYPGESYVDCLTCPSLYNAFGSRLRDDAHNNPSMYDDEIGDLEGYEMAHANEY